MFFGKTPSVSNKTDFPLPFDLKLESAAKREQRFLKGLSLIMIVAYFLSFVVGTLPFLLSGKSDSWIYGASEIIGFIVSTTSYWCSRNISTVKLGSWLIIGYTNLAVCAGVVSETTNHIIPAGFLITMILSLFLLPWLATLIFGLGGVVFTALVCIIQAQQVPALADQLYFMAIEWPLILLISIFIGIFLSIQLNHAHNLALRQTERLNQAVEVIEGKRQFGQVVGERIFTVTTELNSAATQQASGSQQQVSAIVEVTDFLRELSQTASRVADRAANINGVAEKILSSTKQVKSTTREAVETGQQGTEALKRTIASNQQVSRLYKELVEVLNGLELRSGEVRKVVTLMRSISDEIHLLALNAAIEAAGAGEYGERFRVVAAEVKGLADRSVKASQEVSTILGEVENHIQEAVIAVENGQEETRLAVSISQESGTVIDEVALAIEQSAEEVEIIQQAIVTMEKLTKEITQAAYEQRQASAQAVETLQGIGTIARQSASGSLEFTTTARNLEELSQELAVALAT
jgi:methyl-accepting chemotaxis protein